MGLVGEIIYLCKSENTLHLNFEIRGSVKRHYVLTNYLTRNPNILKFEV
jgi:hypothetical protein